MNCRLYMKYVCFIYNFVLRTLESVFLWVWSDDALRTCHRPGRVLADAACNAVRTMLHLIYDL